MALNARQVTVATSATPLSSAPTDSKSGSSILGCNRGSVAVFVGPSGVTTSTGFQLDANQSFTCDLDPGPTAKERQPQLAAPSVLPARIPAGWRARRSLPLQVRVEEGPRSQATPGAAGPGCTARAEEGEGRR